MKVLLRQALASDPPSPPGTVWECEKEEAERLVSAGAAEWLEEPKPKRKATHRRGTAKRG